MFKITLLIFLKSVKEIVFTVKHNRVSVTFYKQMDKLFFVVFLKSYFCIFLSLYDCGLIGKSLWEFLDDLEISYILLRWDGAFAKCV